MKKIMLLATMLAMIALSAVPAMAQPRIVAPNAFRDADINALCSDVGFANSNPNLCRDFIDVNDIDNNFFNNPFRDRFNDGFGRNNGFDIDQDIEETGDVDLNTEIVNTGNNSNQCAAPLQFGNTGNSQNAQFFGQSDSFADDIEFDGGSFEFLPEQAVECGQGVFQSAAASG